MFSIWIGAAGLAMHFEDGGNPKLQAIGAVGGNMEGKEVRFGTAMSGLFAASTTGTSTGAVNSAHDSFTPLGGAVPLVHMMLGEVSPGGTGAGLYAILVFALLAVFIAGLMVGRTPEYIGKKIQATEMKLVVVYLIVMPLLILGFSSLVVRARGPEVVDPQPRPARALGDRLRVHLGREQQRLGLRRPDREHGLVQHHARPDDAVRALLPDRPRARDRGLARAQAVGPGDGRHLPDEHTALLRAAPRGGRRRRRASRTSPSSPSAPSWST